MQRMVEAKRSAPEAFTQQAVERFLYDEAALLDNWQLDDWLRLFTEDGQYIVPTTDLPDGDPRTDLVFIDDDFVRLQGRVRRLKSRHAHREYPWSRTRRLVTNVRITEVRDNEASVEASFLIYRFRAGAAQAFVGHYLYRLVATEDGLKIRYRRATLDHETLRDHGAVSIIL